MRLLDTLMPRACALCAMPLDVARARAGLCRDCACALPGIGATRCIGCALRSTTGLCDVCAHLAPRPTTLSCCDYAPPVDRLVGAFKYRRNLALASAIGHAMAIRLHEHDGSAADALLVPVPIDRTRLAERGFNQANELARVIANRCGLRHSASLLSRRAPTLRQAGLARRQRQANLANTMVAARRASGADCIIIDDVATTGATLQEAERALRAAGARSVIRLVFARTPSP